LFPSALFLYNNHANSQQKSQHAEITSFFQKNGQELRYNKSKRRELDIFYPCVRWPPGYFLPNLAAAKKESPERAYAGGGICGRETGKEQ
jgi:hypothetical protein